MPDARKRGVESVVVLLRDRIELVVVTPRATQRHPQKRFPVALIISSSVLARIWAACAGSWLPTSS